MIEKFRQILQLLDRRTRLRALVLLFLLVVNGAAEMLSIGLIVPFLSAASRDISEQPALVQDLYRWGGFASQGTFILAAGFAVASIFLLRNLFLAYVQVYQYSFIWRARTLVTNRFMRGYMSLPYLTHVERGAAVMVRNLTMVIPEVFSHSVMPMVLLASELVVVATIIGLLLVINFWVTLGTAAALVVVVFVLQRAVGRRLAGWGREATRSTQQILQFSGQAFDAIKDIKVMGREDIFAKRFQAVVGRNADVRQRHNTVTQYPKLVLETLGIWALLAVVSVSVGSGRSLVDTLPTLGLFAVAAMRLMPSFSRINVQLNNLRFSEQALTELVADSRAFPPCGLSHGTPAAVPELDDILVEDVQFTYPRGASPALAGVSLRIQRGESVALVGPSGSGKTTLLNLLLGLLSPDHGSIRANGQRIDADLQAWQSRIGYVPQDIFLFDDSLRANILFGEEPGPDSEARLREAVSLAQLDQLVSRLPMGIDSPVGERGASLSGGERQRVGIARALYRGADILFLDEATSALDADTEASITQALHGLKGRKTVVVIAHRLSSVRDCDRLYLFEDGRLAASGPFDQLAASSATFARLVQRMGMTAHGDDHE